MIHSLLRGGAVATALAATIGLASTLAACASSTTTANVGSGSGVSGTATATSTATGAGAAATATPGASGSINPGGPIEPTPSSNGASPQAQAQAATLPSGAKYVAIDRLTRSSDGRTLYLQTEAQGGACGNFTVVVQESATQVHVGLAKMPVKVGVMCPMYIGERTFPAKLSAPAGSRTVIDLANNATLGS